MKRTQIALGLAAALLLVATPASAGGKGGKKNNKEAAVVSVVHAQVAAALPVDLLIDAVNLPRGFDVPEGAVVEVQWRKPPAEGNAWVLVTATKDAKVVRRGFARVELVGIRQVLVVQRALSKGEVVTEDDLMLEPRVGATGVDLAPQALLGAPVLADLAEGDVVTGAGIGLPAPVARGTSIKVISTSGAVSVTAQARLETTARPGERATARLTLNRTVVHGQLVDDHTMVVQLGGAS